MRNEIKDGPRKIGERIRGNMNVAGRWGEYRHQDGGRLSRLALVPGMRLRMDRAR